ncbi:RCC1 domain-containing protein [Dactylosporangium sp. CA-152071]|uniref:RCC1 domain-containing protein n=1 Tax=Dactylosporangium sp. CA-152071 TaxID=3239933 RepID=UPI003D8C820A
MFGKTIRVIAAAAIAVSTATLSTGSSARTAFTASTSNTANTFTAGTGFAAGTLWTWGDTGDPTPSPRQVGSAASWTSAAVSGSWTCGIQTGGSLWCWGADNDQGQLGVGHHNTRSIPTMVGTATWSQVAAGGTHTCGVRTDTTLWCWGGADNGKLGLGDTTSYDSPQQVVSPAATGWATVSAGDEFTCATRTDTTLYCFGSNDSGQAGIGNTVTPQLTPVAVSTPSTTGWATVSSGYQHACALRTDSTLYCWGDGGSGRLGVNSTARFTSPQQVAGTWSVLSLGLNHTCAIKPDGSLWCWGAGGSGRLGLGDTASRLVPNQVGTIASGTWRTVAGASAHTCATKTDGTQWCWGENTLGELGLNDAVNRTSPVQVGTETTWSTSATGHSPHQTCSTKSDGTLWCWGDLRPATAQPSQVGAASTWRSAALGNAFTCATQSNGTLWCWGRGSNGRLGTGDTNPRLVPTQVGPATTWDRVTAGEYYGCATRTDTTLWCWGDNSQGNLGIGSTTQQNNPAQITSPAATGWASVSAGDNFTCATRIDTTLYCFGRNSDGQVGIGSTVSPQTTPVQVTSPSTTGWTAVSLGYRHACAIRTDQTLYCWGDGHAGRLGLGNGNGNGQPQPTQVPGSTWWAVSLGADHSCAIKTDGSLWCWGSGSSGQLGAGTTADQSAPASVGSATTWRTVSGGVRHTCAVQSVGTVWCWGSNALGQLGLGSGITTQTTPAQVNAPIGRPTFTGPRSNATAVLSY